MFSIPASLRQALTCRPPWHVPAPQLWGGCSASLQHDLRRQYSASTKSQGRTAGTAARGSGAVVLLSGGIESATLLYFWRHFGIRPLYIDYGQKGSQREASSCEELCQDLQLNLARLDLSMVGESFRHLQRPARLHVPLPHRNLTLLSLGAAFTTQIEADTLALALNKDDLGAYSSSSQAFVDSFGGVAAALQPPVRLVTPLSHMTKAQVVTLGSNLGVPFEKSYSCMLGRPRHCGTCSQCQQRRAAFARAGVPEPDGFYQG